MIQTPVLFDDAARANVIAGPNDWQAMTSTGIEWRVHNGSALDILPLLAEESVDCVVTSPPYYSLRDYGAPGQIGLEENVEDYVKSISNVMDEVRRVLRRDGILFLNLGDTYYSGKGKSHGQDLKSKRRRFGLRPVDRSGGLGIGIGRKSAIGVPWRVAIEMMRRDWILRSPIIWHRKSRLPEAVIDRPRRSYEFVFMFVKDRKYFFNRQPLIDRKMEEDMWTIDVHPVPTNGLETAPYPDELVEMCLDIGCRQGGHVLDPFLGGGTTLRVALKSGRNATGIELNRMFCTYVVSQLSKL